MNIKIKIIFMLQMIAMAMYNPCFHGGMAEDTPNITCYTPEEICPQKDIKFWLYNANYTNGTEITSKNIEDAPFSPGLPIKVIIHGINSNRFSSPFKQIRPVFLETGKYNVLCTDWSYFAEQGDSCYYYQTKTIITVGNCTAEIINSICQRRKDMNCSAIHVIGHSLGSQGAGRTGRFLQSLYNITASRITGLDPSIPLYETVYDGCTINQYDGKQVDITHTNAGGAGYGDRMGTVDFYFNGGGIQPGCEVTDSKCSHLRAADIFAESIRNDTKGFYGYKCFWMLYLSDSCPISSSAQFVAYGEYLPPNVTGYYYVDTNGTSPFSLGKYQRAIGGAVDGKVTTKKD